MRNWNIIINLISILIIVIALITMSIHIKSYQRDYDIEKLKIVTEYANKAAFNTILNAGDLDIAYMDMGQVRINPTKSLKIFSELVCLNYNMAINDKNIKHVMSFIPCAILVCNDGYYIAEPSEIMSSNESLGEEYELKWSIKKPFVYEAIQNKKGIALNMYNEDWKMITINNDDTISCEFGNSFIDLPIAHYGITKEKVLEIVNDTINDEMLYAINNNDKKDYILKAQLPTVKSNNGINGINRPTLLVILQGVDFASDKKISNATMSGYKTIRKRIVLGFIDMDGEKRYCYEYQIPESMIFNIVEYFDNTYQASKAGYEPSFDLMEKSVKDDY